MVFNVKDYGAIGDGKTMNTQAIQRTINKCAEHGGGIVLFEKGIYLSGSIELKSNIELNISKGAVLLGSKDSKDFPKRENLKHVNCDLVPRHNTASLIFAEECENISITGHGTIDCNGDYYVEYNDEFLWKYKRKVMNPPPPPRVVFLTGCKNVIIQDIMLLNQPAGWAFWIHDCDFVNFDRVKIQSAVDYPNNDGIHINCSRYVTISNCNIVCGDDSIIVRANSSSLKERKTCENVSVSNCNLTSYSGGIRVGWMNDGVIKNCVFSNLTMSDTTTGISVYLPYVDSKISNDIGIEDTYIANLSFQNIVMDRICSHPVKIFIEDDPRVHIKEVKDLYFSNIHAKGLEFPMLIGRKENHIKNICFDNCDFEMLDESAIPNRLAHGGVTYNDGKWHDMELRYIDGLRLNNVQLNIK